MTDGNAQPLAETPEQSAVRERRQRSRSIAMAVALGVLSLLFYAATIVRMGGNVLNRPLAITAPTMIFPGGPVQ